MIIVKLNETLRVNGLLKIAGTIFKEINRESLEPWLLDEIEYCKRVPTCQTLLVTETAEKAMEIAPKGVEMSVEEVKDIELPPELPPKEVTLKKPARAKKALLKKRIK